MSQRSSVKKQKTKILYGQLSQFAQITQNANAPEELRIRSAHASRAAPRYIVETLHDIDKERFARISVTANSSPNSKTYSLMSRSLPVWPVSVTAMAGLWVSHVRGPGGGRSLAVPLLLAALAPPSCACSRRGAGVPARTFRPSVWSEPACVQRRTVRLTTAPSQAAVVDRPTGLNGVSSG